MTNLDIGLISLVAMVVLIYGGLYVPIALAVTSFVGVWAINSSEHFCCLLLCSLSSSICP